MGLVGRGSGLIGGLQGCREALSAETAPVGWAWHFLREDAALEPYSLEAFISVLVSPILPQRGQMNTWTTTFSVATRAERDQAISRLQASQIGADNCSIECLSISMERRSPAGTF